jgi:hypothetical protein
MIDEKDLLEEIANIEHERWNKTIFAWQQYLHRCCIKNKDGSLTIPWLLVRDWEAQINSDYKDLSEKGKEKDRKEALISMKIIKKYYVTHPLDLL